MTAYPIEAAFQQLEAVGYARDFVRAVVLPEWWEDQLSRSPAILQHAHLAIAQRLHVPFLSLVHGGDLTAEPLCIWLGRPGARQIEVAVCDA